MRQRREDGDAPDLIGNLPQLRRSPRPAAAPSDGVFGAVAAALVDRWHAAEPRAVAALARVCVRVRRRLAPRESALLSRESAQHARQAEDAAADAAVAALEEPESGGTWRYTKKWVTRRRALAAALRSACAACAVFAALLWLRWWLGTIPERGRESPAVWLGGTDERGRYRLLDYGTDLQPLVNPYERTWVAGEAYGAIPAAAIVGGAAFEQRFHADEGELVTLAELGAAMAANLTAVRPRLPCIAGAQLGIPLDLLYIDPAAVAAPPPPADGLGRLLARAELPPCRGLLVGRRAGRVDAPLPLFTEVGGAYVLGGEWVRALEAQSGDPLRLEHYVGRDDRPVPDLCRVPAGLAAKCARWAGWAAPNGD